RHLADEVGGHGGGEGDGQVDVLGPVQVAGDGLGGDVDVLVVADLRAGPVVEVHAYHGPVAVVAGEPARQRGLLEDRLLVGAGGPDLDAPLPCCVAQRGDGVWAAVEEPVERGGGGPFEELV